MTGQASDLIAAWLLANDRPQGVTVEELAGELELDPRTVHQYLYRATKRGLLTKRPASWRLSPTVRTGLQRAGLTL